MTWDHHFFKTCCNFNPVLWKPTKEPSGKDRESIRVRHCDRLDVFGRMAVVHPAVCRVGAPVHGGIRRFHGFEKRPGGALTVAILMPKSALEEFFRSILPHMASFFLILRQNSGE